MTKELTKIILIDLAGLAFFAALVAFPDAIGGITIVGLGLAFVIFIANGIAAQWTWRDTAAVAAPIVLSALWKASHGEKH